ncbi:MAG: ISL3 family transposase [Acidimicrobiales bacterium]
MEINPTRMCELLVGLPDVNVLGITDSAGEALRVHIETRRSTPVGCPTCGAIAKVKDRPDVELVDLPAFGRSTRLVWNKVRWWCAEPDCAMKSWTEEDRRIAAPRMAMTDRAGRWVTEQVGRCARSVSEVAKELGCDWHTINDAVVSYGEALIDDPGRYGDVTALGLDEVLFVRRGPFHRQEFSTSICDVERGQLLDIVPGRSGKRPNEWLEKKGAPWRKKVRYGTLDLSGPYRAVFDKMLPHATQVADPFHVVKWANTKLDECRRRVQNETLGHRGHKADPLYRCRRLLTKADERLDDHGREKLLGLLRAGDPRGDVTTAWHAKEAVRSLYTHTDEATAHEWIDRLIEDMADNDNPIEVRSLSRTLKRWKEHVVAWHRCHLSNGPTEAANNLIKRVKRAAFGFSRFRNYRVRALLYAGKPNWRLLATVTPR